MKKIILAIAIATTVLSAYNNHKSNKEETSTSANPNQLYACSMHPEVIGKKEEKCSKCGMALTEPVKEAVSDKPSATATPTINTAPSATENKTAATPAATTTATNFSIAEIVSNYIALKNALTKDDTKAAAISGKAIVAALTKLDPTNLDAAKKKAFTDIVDDTKENAEHIGDNEGKIDHQRGHFAALSEYVNDLVKTFGSTTKLYQDFCPMYKDGKGGFWISETKEIKNPYFGASMLTCGNVKKEY